MVKSIYASKHTQDGVNANYTLMLAKRQRSGLILAKTSTGSTQIKNYISILNLFLHFKLKLNNFGSFRED